MPRMYNPPPNRVSQLVTSFRAIESILKRDPYLANVIKCWRSWEGASNDKEQPATGSMPFVRLTPKPLAGEWFNPTRHEEPLVIQIEIAYAGTSFDDGANLWRAVELALFPTDNAAKTANETLLQAAGVRGGVATIAQPAIDPLVASQDTTFSVVTGAIKLTVWVTT